MRTKKTLIIAIMGLSFIVLCLSGYYLALQGINSVSNGGVLENTIWNTLFLLIFVGVGFFLCLGVAKLAIWIGKCEKK